MESWYQLIINDDDCLSGESVANVVSKIINLFGVNKIVLGDMEGAFKGLPREDGSSLDADDFIKKVRDAVQYDWAFFFMFKDKIPVGFDVKNINSSIAAATITVRLFDSNYFYLYSESNLLMKFKNDFFPSSNLAEVSFEKLEVLY